SPEGAARAEGGVRSVPGPETPGGDGRRVPAGRGLGRGHPRLVAGPDHHDPGTATDLPLPGGTGPRSRPGANPIGRPARPTGGGAGGIERRHTIRRPVQKYEQLSNCQLLRARIRDLRQTGATAAAIAARLNAEGFQPPRGSVPFKEHVVQQYLVREGLSRPGVYGRFDAVELGPHEWRVGGPGPAARVATAPPRARARGAPRRERRARRAAA